MVTEDFVFLLQYDFVFLVEAQDGGDFLALRLELPGQIVEGGGAKASGYKKGFGFTGAGVVAFPEAGEYAHLRAFCQLGELAGAFAYGFIEDGDAGFRCVADGKGPAQVVAGNVQMDELSLYAAVSGEHQPVGVCSDELVLGDDISLFIHCTRFSRL